MKIRDAVDSLLAVSGDVNIACWNAYGLNALCQNAGGERAFEAGISLLLSGHIDLTDGQHQNAAGMFSWEQAHIGALQVIERESLRSSSDAVGGI